MGSKRLKAIALKRGRIKIPVSDPERVRNISKELIENVKSQSRWVYDYGTLHGIHMNAERTNLPVKNYSTSTWLIPKERFQKFSGDYIRERFSVRRNSCWGCQIHHCDIMKITEGPYAGELLEEPEYEQFSAWSSAIGQEDVTAAMMLSREVDCLGMETNEAGWVVGFVMGDLFRGEFGVQENTASIDSLGVDLKFQKRGIGRALMDEFVRNARAAGGERLYTRVMWNDLPLIQFFDAVGFAPSRMINLELDLS